MLVSLFTKVLLLYQVVAFYYWFYLRADSGKQ
jgi:hypothetical protein